MTSKNSAEPKLDKIRLQPAKISLFGPTKFYDQKLKGFDREHMRRAESAGN